MQKHEKYENEGDRTMTNWNQLADDVLKGYELTKEEVLLILNAPDDEILSLMNAAFKIRKHYFGKK